MESWIKGKYLMDLNSLKQQWLELDAKIKNWWGGDIHVAREEEIRNDPKGTLLYLPFPYITPGGSESFFAETYCWDTHFINLGLFAHKRFDLVKNHILNQLFQIERYGFVITGNRSYFTTRSQTPLLSETIHKYYEHQPDLGLLHSAYPLLKKEYQHYWLADHHKTPTGLIACNDLGDPSLRPELAAEAEITDFTSCFEGDVRKCNPVMINCALVNFAQNLMWISEKLKKHDETDKWKREAEGRKKRIQNYCWDKELGFFFDYHFEGKKLLRYWCLTGFWPLWAGIASQDQAEKMVKNLEKFETEFGLVQTDVAYASPHPEFDWVQWGHPSGWPPMQIIIIEGLLKYGFEEEAKRIAGKYLKLILDIYKETEKIWEKYNVVGGNLEFPVERYRLPAIHGWTSSTVVLFGRLLFENE